MMKTGMAGLTMVMALVCPGGGFATAQEQDGSTIEMLEWQLQQRGKRVEEVAAQIKTIDGRIGRQIDDLVKFLARIKDTKQSGNRVVRLKQHVMEALIQNAEDWVYMRNWLRADLEKTKPAFARELAEEDVKAMEERINQRLRQVVDLAGSLENRKDVPRYKHVRGSRWGRGPSRIRNPAYRHNQKVGVRSEQEINRTSEALAAHLDDLRNRQRLVELSRDEAKDPGIRELLEIDLRRINASIAAREAMLAEMVTKKPKTGPDALSTSRVQMAEKAIQELALDIESDEQKLFDLYHEYLLQRWQVFDLEEKLATAKKD